MMSLHTSSKTLILSRRLKLFITAIAISYFSISESVRQREIQFRLKKLEKSHKQHYKTDQLHSCDILPAPTVYCSDLITQNLKTRFFKVQLYRMVLIHDQSKFRLSCTCSLKKSLWILVFKSGNSNCCVTYNCT